MDQGISFFKMEASGNDFVVIDNRRKIVRDAANFTKKICAYHTGIGADGILLFENSGKADFKMRILNADGSEAEACGNGFRCIALYARKKIKMASKFRFESLAGIIRVQVNSKLVKVELPAPSEIRMRAEIEILGNRLHYSFINTGVPHTVIFVEGLRKIDVENLGRAIRQHSLFKPRGTNVNFVEVKGGNEIHVRTYERGVERETMACGTGSTASAIISSIMGYTTPPVRVKTTGGEILKIDFKRHNKKIEEATLEGEARFVFEGKFLA